MQKPRFINRLDKGGMSDMVLHNEQVDRALGFVRALEAREPIASKASWRELLRILEVFQEHTLLLQEKVCELEAQQLNIHADLGEMINAVSAEGVTFYDELKLTMVALVDQTNNMGHRLEKKVADVFKSHESSIRKLGHALFKITKSMGGSVSSLQGATSAMDEKFETILQRIESVENRLVGLEKRLEQLDNSERDRRDDYQGRSDKIARLLELHPKGRR